MIGQLHQRHRAIEFLKFLKTIDQNVPEHLDVHLVLDNASSHKTPTVRRWLAQHPPVRAALHPDFQQCDSPARVARSDR